jgi:hypothetical protein
MKSLISTVAVIVVFCLCGWAAAADNAQQQKKNLEPLLREVRQLVRRYYPVATVAFSYDKKRQGERIHFEFNTLTYLMKDGSGADPDQLVEVRGPYVGGIWCDMTLVKGHYNGPVRNVEKGVTQIGADFYNRLTAPYSKNLDSHLLVLLRYPGGTPPEFLKRFGTLVKNFDQYVGEPVK